MSKQRRIYTKEEKLEIVLLSLEGTQTIKELSLRFGVEINAIDNWRSEYLKKKRAAPSKGQKILSDNERRIAELERERRALKLECDILKKASSFFSKSDGKHRGS